MPVDGLALTRQGLISALTAALPVKGQQTFDLRLVWLLVGINSVLVY